jgi:hypothetical protein
VTLFGDFLRDDHRRTHKWYQYFPVYESHLRRFRNRHLTVFEIGVGEGGSLEQWRAYLGPFAVLVGIDSNPACAQVAEEEIRIRIGRQEDTAFLSDVLAEFGPPDIVIDDGSHLQPKLTATFEFLYPHVAKNGVYIVEDLHAAYWPNHGGGLRAPTSFIEHAKRYIDEMHAEYFWRGDGGTQEGRTALGDRTRSIHFYDSIVVMEVGEDRPKRHRTTGRVGTYRPDWTPGDPLPDRRAADAPTAVPPPAHHEQIAHLQWRVRSLEKEITVVRASTSWRVTAPLRSLGRLLKS